MTAEPRAIELANLAGQAAADKLAAQVIALDVSERLVLTDVFVVASGSNERQVQAIVQGIDEAMHRAGVNAARKEGLGAGRWVLLDYGVLVVHVQHEEDREYYALERLWGDCPVIALSLPQAPGGGEPAPSL